MGATVAVLGGGAWGSALTVHLAVRSHARPRVVLYLRSARQAHDCAAARENARYLPGITLPASLIFTTELADLRDAEVLIAAPPVGPNIHANVLGYGVIANTFLNTYLG